MHELQTKYALEQDSAKKQILLEQILALIRVGWEQLFLVLSEHDNPHEILLLVADLNRVFDERREQLKRNLPPAD